MPAISIIVPVYNAEKYIHRCLDSLLAQTFTDFEVLLIDDGSPDNSGKICDDYAHFDSRVQVFHKENEGVSSARNLGLDNAEGKWLMFVDADDWLDEGTLQLCLNNVGDADFVRFGMNVIYSPSYSVVDKSINQNWNYDEYFENLVGRKTSLSVWCGLYLRKLFEKNSIRFNTAYALGEDWLVLYSLLKVSSKIKLIEHPLYNYNLMNSDSAVHTLDEKKSLQLIEVAAIICCDAYSQKGNSIAKDISDCKCDISSICLAALLLKKTGLGAIKAVLQSLNSKYLYPSCREIYMANLSLKFKLLLLFFSAIIKLRIISR